jgi:hypothetical protein
MSLPAQPLAAAALNDEAAAFTQDKRHAETD